MTVKLIVMLKRKKGMSREEFRDLYENGHAPLGKGVFGHLWKEYRQNYLTAANSFQRADGAPLESQDAEADAPFDVITEFVFEKWADLEEQNRLANLPENKKILSQDEDTLFDRRNCYVSVCEVVEADLSAN